MIVIFFTLSALIFAFLPSICNCVGCFNTKVEEVLARTKRIRSRRTRRSGSRRRRTTSRRSSRKEIKGTVNDWIHSRVAVSVSAEVKVVLF